MLWSIPLSVHYRILRPKPNKTFYEIFQPLQPNERTCICVHASERERLHLLCLLGCRRTQNQCAGNVWKVRHEARACCWLQLPSPPENSKPNKGFVNPAASTHTWCCRLVGREPAAGLHCSKHVQQRDIFAKHSRMHAFLYVFWNGVCTKYIVSRINLVVHHRTSKLCRRCA